MRLHWFIHRPAGPDACSMSYTDEEPISVGIIFGKLRTGEQIEKQARRLKEKVIDKSHRAVKAAAITAPPESDAA